MAYDPGLAERVRYFLIDAQGVDEREMFGGIGFMLDGNMAVGVIGEDLLVRVGRDKYEEALEIAGARPFDMTGRPMRGWVVVSADVLEDDAELDAWVHRGSEVARSLPAK